LRELQKRGLTAVRRKMFAVLLLCLPGLCLARPDPLPVFVSIPPQAWLLERLAGDRLRIETLLGAGANPHNYDPLPRQLVRFADAKLYFAIGIPFESMWRDRLHVINPQLEFVSCGGEEVDAHDHHHGHGHHDDEHHSPHVWTSPGRFAGIAECMHAALVRHDPAGRDDYDRNLSGLLAALRELDREIGEILDTAAVHYLLVQHPAWDHFAEHYGLEQIAIEKHGHEPNARHLVGVIERSQTLGLDRVFVQPQISHAAARLVSSAIGARLITVDPMARDYPAALRRLATALAEP